jgi:F-type H+-transporting ATPase subunit delta
VKNFAIARRYAKALLLIGKEDGQTEQYREELQGVAELLAGQKQLADTLANPLYSTEDRKKVLEMIIEKLDLSKAMAAFMALLFEKGRVGFIGSINDFFQKLADELKGVARPAWYPPPNFPPIPLRKFAALSKRTGKDIILEVEQDPGLIGGIVTRIGDLVLDGSIKTQLLNMRESLKRGESV